MRVFEPEQLVVMGAAYDRVMVQLERDLRHPPPRERVAAYVIEEFQKEAALNRTGFGAA